MKQALTTLLWMAIALNQLTAQATVAALQQNYVWAGINNPMDVTSTLPFDAVRLTGGSMTEIELKGDRHAQFMVLPEPGAETVSMALTLGHAPATSAAVFRVKVLPSPAFRFGNVTSGDSASTEQLLNSQMVARMEAIELDVELTWRGFSMSTMIDGDIEVYTSTTNELSQEMKSALSEAPAGTNLFFNNMQVETPDGAFHTGEAILLFKR